MNDDDDLEQVWKELIVVCLEVISCYFFEYTKNITETQSKHQVSRPRSKLRTSKVEAVGLTKLPGRENGMYKYTKFISRITSIKYNMLHRPIRVLIKTKFSSCIIRNVTVLLTEYCAGAKIEKNEMGGACDAYGGGERGAQGSGGET